MAETKKYIWDFLRGTCNYSKAGAAAVMGCWMEESSCNPASFEGDYLGYETSAQVFGNKPKSCNDYCVNYLFPAYASSGLSIDKEFYKIDGYYWPGLGLAGWTGVNISKLLNYAKQVNKQDKVETLEVQLNFFKWDMEHNFSSTNSAMKSATDVYAATETFGRAYELSTMPASWMANRQSQAISIYNTYKDTSITTDITKYRDVDGDVSSGTSGGGLVSDPNAVINAEAINALIISIDPTVKPKDINYDKMTENHVSGVMFKAGAFFDAEHKVYVYSRNENLDAQVRSAIDAGFRFGLFFDVRAKTVEEAKKECEQLYYTVSKYPPALGLWLHIMFKEKDKKKNNKIMDYYITEMNRWGLSFGCGLYCTKSELAKIDWDKYQENFYLWYVNKFTSNSEFAELNKVLSPSFFTI